MEDKVLLISLLIVMLIFEVMSLTYVVLIKNSRGDVEGVVFVEGQHDPVIIPSEFSNKINNKYLTYYPGDKYVYEARVQEGTEKIEVYVTDEQRTVMGIPVVVVWDRVWLNGDLIEETYDWYSQDREGNVWYMGEDSVGVVLGEIVSHAGSFEAGVDGAKAGIIMHGNPVIGERYYQEFYRGKAEDQGEIVAYGETVRTPYGILEDCLKTLDINPLDGGMEHKYYCPEVRGIALEVGLDDGERVELISYEKNAQPTPKEILTESKMGEITEEEARRIALKEVSGKVTDISVEQKFGRKTYVVEVDADSGPETDVVIDFKTGEVLGVET